MGVVWRNGQRITVLVMGGLFLLSLVATGADPAGLNLGHLYPVVMTIGLAICLASLVLSISAQTRESQQLMVWFNAVCQGNWSCSPAVLRTPGLAAVAKTFDELVVALRKDVEETLPRVADADFEQVNQGPLRHPLSRLHQNLHGRLHADRLARANVLAKSHNLKVVAKAMAHGTSRSLSLVQEGLAQIEHRQTARAGQLPRLMELEANLTRVARRLPTMEAQPGTKDFTSQAKHLETLANQFQQLAQNATVEAVRLGRQGDGVQRFANHADRLSEELKSAVKRLSHLAEGPKNLSHERESLELVTDYISALKVAQRDEAVCDKALLSSLKQLEASVRHGSGLGRQLMTAVMPDDEVAQAPELATSPDAIERNDDRSRGDQQMQSYVADNTRFRRDKPATGSAKPQVDVDALGGRAGEHRIIDLSQYRAQSD